MQTRTCRSWLFAAAGIMALALLSGCGGSSNSTAIPTTATIFYAHSAIFKNSSSSLGYQYTNVFRNTTTTLILNSNAPAHHAPSDLVTMGYNSFGQLGDGTLNSRTAAAPVTSLGLDWVGGVATGADHTLAFGSDSGIVQSWGSNYHGQLGNETIATTGSAAYSATPVRVGTLSGVTSVAAGGFHSLAVAADGVVWSWGYNSNGQLGNGERFPSDHPKPVPVWDELAGSQLNNVRKVAAGGLHSLALTNDGKVYAWGDNSYGQLGRDTSITSSSSAQLVQLGGTDLDNVVDIAAGGSFSVALRGDGTVWAWGFNGDGELGSTPDSIAHAIPVQIGSLHANRIAAGLRHILARLPDGTVVAWGSNDYGQLGNNNLNMTNSFIPVQVEADASHTLLRVVSDIVASGYQSLALSGGLWYGWGDNTYGQLGNPTPANAISKLLLPTKVQYVTP